MENHDDAQARRRPEAWKLIAVLVVGAYLVSQTVIDLSQQGLVDRIQNATEQNCNDLNVVRAEVQQRADVLKGLLVTAAEAREDAARIAIADGDKQLAQVNLHAGERDRDLLAKVTPLPPVDC